MLALLCSTGGISFKAYPAQPVLTTDARSAKAPSAYLTLARATNRAARCRSVLRFLGRAARASTWGSSLAHPPRIHFVYLGARPLFRSPSRYGVYPDSKNWYISGGSFPSPPPPPAPPANRLSVAKPKQYRKYYHQNADGHFDVKAILANSMAPPAPPPAGFSAQIVKTTDGGSSWTSLFSANGASPSVAVRRPTCRASAALGLS